MAERLSRFASAIISAEASVASIVLAATDDHAVNRQIVKECRQKGILSNRCDCREDCDFYFPALVQAEGLTIGLCSNGEDHKKVKGAAAWLREAIAQREKKE